MGQVRELAKARMNCHLPMLPNPDGTQECSPSQVSIEKKKLANHDDCLCQVVDVFSAINSDTRPKDTTNPLGEADSQCPQACVLRVKSIFYLKKCLQARVLHVQFN